MQRREFVKRAVAHTLGASLIGNIPFAMSFAATEDGGNPNSRPLPRWFDDAKLGIFIHWGLYSVPAWAPPICAGSRGMCSNEVLRIQKHNFNGVLPYAEWYLNGLRMKGPTWEHHKKVYGADFDYYEFARLFEKQNRAWHADNWATLFSRIGAKYVVLTTKHHDGYRLWPSKVENPRHPKFDITSKRDLVGELTQSVRAHGMKMGLYYSGGLDWTFTTAPIVAIGNGPSMPQSPEYADYIRAQWQELVDRYEPSIMWNDINYPKLGKMHELFARFYDKVPDGVINDRFDYLTYDFTTPEYKVNPEIVHKKWESCRGLGTSFGYSQMEGDADMIPSDALIRYFVDIVSKNGNLLLNVGPRADGSISDVQAVRLEALGAWLARNGEGIFGSRPWIRASDASSGADLRYTTKDGALYAFVLARSDMAQVEIPNVRLTPGSEVVLVADKRPLTWRAQGEGVVISTPIDVKDAVPALRMSVA